LCQKNELKVRHNLLHFNLHWLFCLLVCLFLLNYACLFVFRDHAIGIVFQCLNFKTPQRITLTYGVYHLVACSVFAYSLLCVFFKLIFVERFCFIYIFLLLFCQAKRVKNKNKLNHIHHQLRSLSTVFTHNVQTNMFPS
jgi:hypothetical protein